MTKFDIPGLRYLPLPRCPAAPLLQIRITLETLGKAVCAARPMAESWQLGGLP